MCCIFTCFGWLIDLVQRLWTFAMSCCISSAVCCVMLTSSMSGIALGYNYSLAEYIDLKETNVSIYLKRGVFDDEMGDDMDWRRSGRLPVAGHIKEDDLMTGRRDDDTPQQKSGRRLDDSVFDADDQNKYEGSLMKLTARPQIITGVTGRITDDIEMGDTLTKYPSGSLDQMKAIQSLIDSRRAMATGGTTLSPLATYHINERTQPHYPMYVNPNIPNSRRMMARGPGMKPGDVQPARNGVPDESIGAPENWVIPKRPDLFDKNVLPAYDVFSPTYPSPITLNLGPRRTTESTTPIPLGVITFATRTTGLPEPTTKPAVLAKLEKESAEFNEKFLLESEPINKNEYKHLKMGPKTSEEEYEDEIKGLPVRKRRHIIATQQVLDTNANISRELNVTDTACDTNCTTRQVLSNSTEIKNTTSSTKEVAFTKTTVEKIRNNDSDILTIIKRPSDVDQINNLTTRIDITNRTTYTEEPTSDSDHKAESTSKKYTQNVNKIKCEKTLLDRLITIAQAKQSTLTVDATQNSKHVSSKKVKIRSKRKPFESKIVSSKYSTNSKPASAYKLKQAAIDTQELINSISISLSEAGLLGKSSNFVKLLQSTLT